MMVLLVLISLVSSPSVQPLSLFSLAVGLVQEFRSIPASLAWEAFQIPVKHGCVAGPGIWEASGRVRQTRLPPWTHGAPPHSPFANPLNSRKRKKNLSRNTRGHDQDFPDDMSDSGIGAQPSIRVAQVV